MNKRNPQSTAKERVLTDFQKLQAVWGRMRQSCTDVNHRSYKNYGAKGVTVDKEAWPTGAAFAEWALANGFEPGLTVERIDSDGPYTPSNVTFATRLVQQRNLTVNIYYDYQGEQLTLGEVFERELGGYSNSDVSRTSSRLQKGWELLAAIHTPPHQRHYALYEYQGEQLPLYKIMRRHLPNLSKEDFHLTHSRIYGRLKRGMPLVEALTRPARAHFRKPAPEYLA